VYDRRLAEPEGIDGGLPWASTDAQLARLDFLDQIDRLPSWKMSGRHTLVGEILVERSDEGLRRLEDTR